MVVANYLAARRDAARWAFESTQAAEGRLRASREHRAAPAIGFLEGLRLFHAQGLHEMFLKQMFAEASGQNPLPAEVAIAAYRLGYGNNSDRIALDRTLAIAVTAPLPKQIAGAVGAVYQTVVSGATADDFRAAQEAAHVLIQEYIETGQIVATAATAQPEPPPSNVPPPPRP